MKSGSRLLKVLLQASEKAANIARTCRQKEALFQLLVQEKSLEEKNPRFFQDFKTLADVLIQETIRHDIEIEFPELAKLVQGEETNVFSNTMGESIIVEVCSCSKDTTQLLTKVMSNDAVAAELLAAEVHKDVQLSDVPITLDFPNDFEINVDDLGIWIDPIDSTADYISATEAVDEQTGIHLSGLRCVTVLIGAYKKSTGVPVLGVVNQPFCANVDSQWTGKCYWGFLSAGIAKSSISDTCSNVDKIILLSRFEDADVKSKLLNSGFRLVEVAGAGYKILSVAIGQAAAYILSKGSTYKWDTCGPQALLSSVGGSIIEFKEFIVNPDSDNLSVNYLPIGTNFSNRAGLIAYRDPQILETFKGILSRSSR
ncbi:PREDICTED: inositol polyphosphate 1-phosphatase [Vollenhovia emeryi]|uniref:inositol polyphosphate 1-phosphatase n=1 Tax=Vollenhovia emeryi TaxID=411798 RepID=UPI0005F48E38|nr:PREDICTED: inositol polyphosphate 1-phosphatase [Vollenhovia emeryi]XP_011873373.1 PREDICTED: inositol polyphosphate 1-phosphatase [Vollenhovia emeryi]XP_011873374.1 PREDICTED: inositol polyphosphate 1-phosphatase [Vollenhovia emeryi]XP_011873375.1 PREDICTED: inositol polyphosphate 1-phosphatase [Vollenhovia emeryi]XP_011873376.1 PREDICTED: inositol polyphosphate 1-phosphatase [Vollenhovia emeryi]